MEKQRVPLLLVTDLINIRYATGFRGTAGVALFGPEEALLWVDPRYTLQAQQEAPRLEVIEEKHGLLRGVASWLRRNEVRHVGYEPSHLTCAELDQLVRATHTRVKFKSAGALIEELRLVKDQQEIENIRRAGKLIATVFEGVLHQVRPGVSESDLAAEIEYRIRKNGAERTAFETIVASGIRGAYPHARASSKLLEKNEFVIFDLGAILSGYAADMTRTVYLGEPSRRVRNLFYAVVGAQRRAVEALRAGVRAGDVDAAARRAVQARGLGRYFTHSTGHGVGLEVHEGPRLGRGEKTRLKPGYVVTVEPAVYLEGFGGVRIEDTVLVRPEGPEVLTPACKENWVIN